ncbi:MAG: anti-sigma factor [Balneolaceae bacterium]
MIQKGVRFIASLLHWYGIKPLTNLFYRIDRLNERPSERSSTFAVTLEPKGGVPQPTGGMYLIDQQN